MKNRDSHNNLTLVIAAGGTGGHVYPALAIAEAVQQQHPAARIIFVGTRNHMESRVVPEAGFEMRYIWISGFHRRLTLKNLLFPVKLFVSLLQSLHLLININPHAVLSCGGYVAGPVGYMAALLRIPLALQEQNSYPGATNRILGKKASRIYTAFEEANEYFPSEHVIRTGNPTRSHLADVDRSAALKFFDFSEDRQTLLVMGGSGGARTINRVMKNHLDALHNELGLQIIWICGNRYEAEIRQSIDLDRFPRLRLYDFLDKIAQAYAVADLVVSRAGASSCAELQLTGNAALLVPSPNVAGDHQRKNARAMMNAGAAEVIEDANFEQEFLIQLRNLLSDSAKLQQMQKASRQMARPDAAEDIANDLMNMVTRKKSA